MMDPRIQQALYEIQCYSSSIVEVTNSPAVAADAMRIWQLVVDIAKVLNESERT
jgi:hypothetical protein